MTSFSTCLAPPTLARLLAASLCATVAGGGCDPSAPAQTSETTEGVGSTATTIVYLNGGGATLIGGGEQSDAAADLVEGEFPAGAFAEADSVRFAALTEQLQADFAAYPIEITTRRPPAGTDYMMLVVAAQPTPIQGFISLAGLDCGNGNARDVGLLFDDPSAPPSPQRLARGAAYAIGLMLGVYPTGEPSDAMFPALGEGAVEFVDACLPVATTIECEPEPRGCESGSSNSYLELQGALGI